MYWWALPLNNQTESLSLWGLDVNILSLGLITVPLERHFLISSYVYKLGFCNLDSGILEAGEDPMFCLHLTPRSIPESDAFRVYILQKYIVVS